MTRDLLKTLAQRPLLCDGAMGTQLFAAGLEQGRCGETWNVDEPAKVQAIHQRYRDAGCDLITTNSFGASPLSLARHELASRCAELNQAAAKVARAAAGDAGYVLAGLGPFGGLMEPYGDVPQDQVRESFQEQAHALHAGGADACLVETMTDADEMRLAIAAARAVGDWPVLGTFAFGGAGGTYHTMMGVDPAGAVQAARDAGASVIGANCGSSLSLEDYLLLAQQLVAAAGDLPVILQPNAGSPIQRDGQTIYPASPAEMAALVPKLLNIGVRIIGGCCGTSPAHLAAMAQALRQAQ